MENDGWQKIDFEGTPVSNDLIKALSFALLKALEDWQKQRGIEEMESEECAAAMMAAAFVVMNCLNSETLGPTIQ